MKRQLLDILACPVDKSQPLELHEVRSDGDTIMDGVLFCTRCSRFYPIIDEIPVMFPDELRNKEQDLDLLRKWSDKLPAKIVRGAKPWHVE